MPPFRTLALTAATLLAIAGSARADVNYIIDTTPPIPGLFQTEPRFKQVLSIAMVRSEQGGSVSLYDYRLGEVGVLIDSHPVHPGANPDLRFDLGRYANSRVIAILYDPAGAEVARKVIWRR